jgi:hypothetical protein
MAPDQIDNGRFLFFGGLAELRRGSYFQQNSHAA